MGTDPADASRDANTTNALQALDASSRELGEWLASATPELGDDERAELQDGIERVAVEAATLPAVFRPSLTTFKHLVAQGYSLADIQVAFDAVLELGFEPSDAVRRGRDGAPTVPDDVLRASMKREESVSLAQVIHFSRFFGLLDILDVEPLDTLMAGSYGESASEEGDDPDVDDDEFDSDDPFGDGFSNEDDLEGSFGVSVFEVSFEGSERGREVIREREHGVPSGYQADTRNFLGESDGFFYNYPNDAKLDQERITSALNLVRSAFPSVPMELALHYMESFARRDARTNDFSFAFAELEEQMQSQDDFLRQRFGFDPGADRPNIPVPQVSSPEDIVEGPGESGEMSVADMLTRLGALAAEEREQTENQGPRPDPLESGWTASDLLTHFEMLHDGVQPRIEVLPSATARVESHGFEEIHDLALAGIDPEFLEQCEGSPEMVARTVAHNLGWITKKLRTKIQRTLRAASVLEPLATAEPPLEKAEIQEAVHAAQPERGRHPLALIGIDPDFAELFEGTPQELRMTLQRAHRSLTTACDAHSAKLKSLEELRERILGTKSEPDLEHIQSLIESFEQAPKYVERLQTLEQRALNAEGPAMGEIVGQMDLLTSLSHPKGDGIPVWELRGAKLSVIEEAAVFHDTTVRAELGGKLGKLAQELIAARKEIEEGEDGEHESTSALERSYDTVQGLLKAHQVDIEISLDGEIVGLSRHTKERRYLLGAVDFRHCGIPTAYDLLERAGVTVQGEIPQIAADKRIAVSPDEAASHSDTPPVFTINEEDFGRIKNFVTPYVACGSFLIVLVQSSTGPDYFELLGRCSEVEV